MGKLSDTSVNFEEIEIDKILDEKNKISEVVSDFMINPTTTDNEDEEDEEIGIYNDDSDLENGRVEIEDDIEKSKKKVNGDNDITKDYLHQVVSGFLRTYKKKMLVRTKKSEKKDREIVEYEIVWYRHLIKKMFKKGNAYLSVNFQDIVDYRNKILDKESISKLIYKLRNEPYVVREIFNKNVELIYKEIFEKELLENIRCNELLKIIQVGFVNFREKAVQLNTLRTQYLSKFEMVEGVISQYDETPRVKILESVWICLSCKRQYTQKGAKKPYKCIEKDCSSRAFEMDLSKQKSEDYLDIQLTQQFGGIQKNSTVSRYVRITGTALVNYVLNNVSPGQIATIHGVIVIGEKPVNAKDQDDSGDIEIDAFSVEQKNNINVFDYDERLLNIVKDYINESNIQLHFDKLKRSICAHVYKQDPIKEAVLLQLVGTNPRIRPDGTRLKGDINVLNVGNSGVAKSDFGVYIQMVIPHSIKAGTKGSTSVAGLTSFVDRNPKTGKSMISLGVLALVDRKGIAIVEEINRRNKQDLYEFANATDDNQQIYVNKGGFHSIIFSRCPIYATANSLKNNGIWDDSQTVSEQTHIDAFILSRMDLVFVSHVERTREYKERLMSHIEKEYNLSILEKEYESALEGNNNVQRTEEALKRVEVQLRQNDFSGTYPIEYMRHEIYYLKSIDCRCNQGTPAYKKLRQFWTDFSSMGSLTEMSFATDDVAGKTLEAESMDIRKFSSLIKLTEAYGRLFRHQEATVDDAQKAIDLMALSLASQIPKLNAASLEEQNEYARKMMEKNTVKRMADSMTREKQILKKRVFVSFTKQLNRFNDILYKQGWQICKTCHGTGETSELVDSDNNKMEIHQCLNCNGKGGEDRGFTYLSFEENIVNNNVMKDTRCKYFFEMYSSKRFLIYRNNLYYHNINLKSPDVTDAITKIAESITEAYMERVAKDEEIRAMNSTNKGRVIGPTPASSLLSNESGEQMFL